MTALPKGEPRLRVIECIYTKRSISVLICSVNCFTDPRLTPPTRQSHGSSYQIGISQRLPRLLAKPRNDKVRQCGAKKEDHQRWSSSKFVQANYLLENWGLQGSAASGGKSDRSSWAAACFGASEAQRESLAATRGSQATAAAGQPLALAQAKRSGKA